MHSCGACGGDAALSFLISLSPLAAPPPPPRPRQSHPFLYLPCVEPFKALPGPVLVV